MSRLILGKIFAGLFILSVSGIGVNLWNQMTRSLSDVIYLCWTFDIFQGHRFSWFIIYIYIFNRFLFELEIKRYFKKKKKKVSIIFFYADEGFLCHTVVYYNHSLDSKCSNFVLLEPQNLYLENFQNNVSSFLGIYWILFF